MHLNQAKISYGINCEVMQCFVELLLHVIQCTVYNFIKESIKVQYATIMILSKCILIHALVIVSPAMHSGT